MGHRDMHRTCPRLDTIQRNIFHRVQKNLHCIPAMESTFDPSRNHTKFKQDPIESLPSIISHSIQNIRPCAKVAFNAPVSIGSPKAVPVPWHSTRCSCGPVSSANARAFKNCHVVTVSQHLIASSRLLLGTIALGNQYFLEEKNTAVDLAIRGNSSLSLPYGSPPAVLGRWAP